MKLCKDKIECVRHSLKEYEAFARCSGLELNADKTELFIIGGENSVIQYRSRYLNEEFVE